MERRGAVESAAAAVEREGLDESLGSLWESVAKPVSR